MKILLVEDDPTAALMVESVLKSQGHEVVLATDAITAYATLNREAIRLVVSDWQMGTHDGLELCQRIRQRKEVYVYFILLTQMQASDENQRAAMQAGVDDFLSKPVRPAEMRVRLHVAERILGFTQQVKQLQSYLPICGYCRKVRDDRDYWAGLEEYILKHSGSSFTHGICPDCYQRQVVPQMERFGIAPPPYQSPKPPPAD